MLRETQNKSVEFLQYLRQAEPELAVSFQDWMTASSNVANNVSVTQTTSSWSKKPISEIFASVPEKKNLAVAVNLKENAWVEKQRAYDVPVVSDKDAGLPTPKNKEIPEGLWQNAKDSGWGGSGKTEIGEGLLIEKEEVQTAKGVATMGEHEHETSEDADKELLVNVVATIPEEAEDDITDTILLRKYGGKDGIIKFLKENNVKVRSNWKEEKALNVLRQYLEHKE